MATDDFACKDFVELVTSYLEHTLNANDVQRFEAHLADCPYCDDYLDQMRETIGLVGRLSEESLPEEVKTDMLSRFRDWLHEANRSAAPE
jgi:anti-sigma factor RsiW